MSSAKKHSVFMAERIVVEIAYAQPQRQILKRVEVSFGSTAIDAVEASGIADELQLDRANLQLGIFGRPISAQTILHDADRVEIYRPLKIDPKEARRRRAKSKR
jgi:uncharacterized protein